MDEKRYALKATVKTVNQEGIRGLLDELFGVDAFMLTDGGFRVSSFMVGESARELNRSFLEKLRRVEKRTTLRAEWTNEGSTERFFDYVPKGMRKG